MTISKVMRMSRVLFRFFGPCNKRRDRERSFATDGVCDVVLAGKMITAD